MQRVWKLEASGRWTPYQLFLQQGAQVNVTGENFGKNYNKDPIASLGPLFRSKLNNFFAILVWSVIFLSSESDGQIYQFGWKIVWRLAYYSPRSATSCAGLLPRTTRESIALAPNKRFQLIVNV